MRYSLQKLHKSAKNKKNADRHRKNEGIKP